MSLVKDKSPIRESNVYDIMKRVNCIPQNGKYFALREAYLYIDKNESLVSNEFCRLVADPLINW